MLTFYSDTELTPRKEEEQPTWDEGYPWVEPDQELSLSVKKEQPVHTGLHGRYYKLPYG